VARESLVVAQKIESATMQRERKRHPAGGGPFPSRKPIRRAARLNPASRRNSRLILCARFMEDVRSQLAAGAVQPPPEVGQPVNVHNRASWSRCFRSLVCLRLGTAVLSEQPTRWFTCPGRGGWHGRGTDGPVATGARCPNHRLRVTVRPPLVGGTDHAPRVPQPAWLAAGDSNPPSPSETVPTVPPSVSPASAPARCSTPRAN
jgi:hypothetical protein